jgi:hypothetical protein
MQLIFRMNHCMMFYVYVMKVASTSVNAVCCITIYILTIFILEKVYLLCCLVIHDTNIENIDMYLQLWVLYILTSR